MDTALTGLHKVCSSSLISPPCPTPPSPLLSSSCCQMAFGQMNVMDKRKTRGQDPAWGRVDSVVPNLPSSSVGIVCLSEYPPGPVNSCTHAAENNEHGPKCMCDAGFSAQMGSGREPFSCQEELFFLLLVTLQQLHKKGLQRLQKQTHCIIETCCWAKRYQRLWSQLSAHGGCHPLSFRAVPWERDSVGTDPTLCQSSANQGYGSASGLYPSGI